MKFRKLISALTAGCLMCSGAAGISASAAGFSRASVHDPSIVKLEDGSYYIIGSHLGAARSFDLGNWTAAANSNLGSTNTTFFKNIYTDLAVPEKWSNTTNGYNLAGNMWAPDIIYNEAMGKYCMYLSINGQVWNSSIVLCTSDNIDGPYSYQGTIVYSGFTNKSVNNVNETDVPKVLGNNPDISRYLGGDGSWNAAYGTNAIDPAVFYDEEGDLWMIYGSWFGGLYMLELDENTGLRDYNVKYETIANVSDAYMGKKAAGGNFVSGEGPYIEYMKAPGSNKGYYYLFVSYGFFNSNGGYNMRIFRSESPDGPYVDQNGNSAVFSRGGDNIGGTVGERLMSNYQWDCNDRPFKAQGHNSVLMDDDGKLFVIYHTKFDDPYGFHEVRVHQMIMNEDGWPTAAAYEYTGETLSEVGHTIESVTGEYEFIFHTLDQKFVNEQSADVERSKDIVLNANGTVTGDITGTWTMRDGSPEMALTFGGVTYKGSFLVQADESSAMTQKMTFTATGNNTCVWGSKKSAYKASEDIVDLMNPDSKLVYNAETAGGYGEAVRLVETELLSGVSYTITNKHSGKVLDLDGGNTNAGTNIQQWTNKGGSNQEWRITASENGYCKIVSMSDESKCIAITENSAENGLNVELQKYNGADNQQWKLIQNGSYYGIVSKCSDGKSGLDVFDWSTDDGGNINQWEYWGGDCQLWRIEAVHPAVPDGEYTIRNVNSGLFIADDNGNAVQSSAQCWKFTRQNDGTYTVQAQDGRALTVENGSAEDGANILLSGLIGDVSQKFMLRCSKDGSYSLITAVSGGTRCADVYEISMDKGANICQWEYWGGDGQKFILEPAKAEEKKVIGDVNADGEFTMLDAVMMQRFLLNIGSITDITAGDLCEDGRINVFDMLLMRKMLLTENENSKTEITPTEYMNNVSANIVDKLPYGMADTVSGVDYGEMRSCTYYSTTRERNTPVRVLLPAGYNENEEYPVLYMLHGYWNDETTLSSPDSGLQNIAGNLIASGEAEKMIVVFPYIYTSKDMPYCTAMDDVNNQNYDNFIYDLEADLMPWIENNFSVKTGRENTAISGFSMGGRESLYIGIKLSDKFGYVGSVCTAPGVAPGILSESEMKFAEMPYMVLISGAVYDGVVGNCPENYHNMLTANGVEHIWNSIPEGGHDNNSIQPHFYNLVKNIFRV